MSGSFCVICQAEPEHGYLCGRCYPRLFSMLREIEDETALLETMPSMQMRTGSSGSLASHRAPAIIDTIVARDPRRGLMRWASMDDDDLKAFDPMGLDNTASVLETLHSRARTVREDLDYTPPARVTVMSERALLTDELAWISRQPWIDEMFHEMRDLLAQLKRTNKTHDDRPVGYCHLIRYESTCGGRIWQREQERHIWRQAEPGSDRCRRIKVTVNDGPAYCERCRAIWDDPKELDRLHLIEEKRKEEAARPKTSDGRRMLTVKELAALHQATPNAIRVRLSKLQVKAIRGHYDPAALEEASKEVA